MNPANTLNAASTITELVNIIKKASSNGTNGALQPVESMTYTSKDVIIVEEGNVFKFPEGTPPDEVAKAAVQWAKQMEEIVSFKEIINAAVPTEAAIVLSNILREKYPMLTMKGDFGMFTGYEPPEVVSITIAPGESHDIMLGNLLLPGFSDGEALRIGITSKGVVIECNVRRKREAATKELIAEVQSRVTSSTIFNGKALRFGDISWVNSRRFDLVGDTPTVFDLSGVNEEWLVLNEAEKSAVNARIIGRITMSERYRELGRKQGGVWLFSGQYGTGKSYAISVAMKKAIESGWTVIQFDKASQFNQAIEIALKMQKTNNQGILMVIEDVELVMPSDRKDEAMTELSNLIDGANKEFRKTMLIMTTNEVSSIHPLFKRRCEIIPFDAPGHDARVTLIRQFLARWDMGDGGIDYNAVSEALVIPNNGDPVIFTPFFVELICDVAIEQAIVNNSNNITTEMLLNAITVATPQVLSVYRPDGSAPPTASQLIAKETVDHLFSSPTYKEQAEAIVKVIEAL